MNKTLIAGLSALSLICGVAAASADEIAGRVAAIDQDAQTITLENGMSFVVNENVSIENLKQGDEVLVTFEKEEGENVATGVERSEN